jgi:hypothetical protein
MLVKTASRYWFARKSRSGQCGLPITWEGWIAYAVGAAALLWVIFSPRLSPYPYGRGAGAIGLAMALWALCTWQSTPRLSAK